MINNIIISNMKIIAVVVIVVFFGGWIWLKYISQSFITNLQQNNSIINLMANLCKDDKLNCCQKLITPKR